jgi:hypothetical protein
MSGDAAATLSENNAQCDSQINSKTTSSVSGDIRTIDGLDGTHTNEDKVKIKLIIQFIICPKCEPGRATDHGCNGHAGSYLGATGPGTANILRGDVTIGEGQMGKTTEASLPYNRVIFIETTVSPRFLDLNGYEVISSQIGNKPDDFDCTQRHNPLESISCHIINTTKD